MSEEKQTIAGVGILVAAFPTEDGGQQAMQALKQAKKEKKIHFADAAVVSQDAEGGVHYHETKDMSTGKGAGVGALVGGVIGILGGPGGIVVGAGAGALLGGVFAHGDAGYDDDSLEQLGTALRPGTSALAIVSSGKFLHAVRKSVSNADMREALSNLSAELVSKLDEGKSVALGLVLTEEGLIVNEVAANDEVTEVIGLVATEDGVLGGAAVATEDGVAYAMRAETEDVAAYEVGVATEEGAAVEHGVITEDGAVIEGAAVTEDEAVVGTAVITPVEEEEEKKE